MLSITFCKPSSPSFVSLTSTSNVIPHCFLQNPITRPCVTCSEHTSSNITDDKNRIRVPSVITFFKLSNHSLISDIIHFNFVMSLSVTWLTFLSCVPFVYSLTLLSYITFYYIVLHSISTDHLSTHTISGLTTQPLSPKVFVSFSPPTSPKTNSLSNSSSNK